MAQSLAATDRPYPGPIHLETGEIIAADLVIPALGARPASGGLMGLANAGFDPIGRVKVDGWMRLGGRQRAFALGDMAANGDMMTIVAASRQVTWLAATLRAVAIGKPIGDLPEYRPWPTPPILVPLGKRRGASVLPITTGGLVVGSFLTSLVKGKSLFIPRYRT